MSIHFVDGHLLLAYDGPAEVELVGGGQFGLVNLQLVKEVVLFALGDHECVGLEPLQVLLDPVARYSKLVLLLSGVHHLLHCQVAHIWVVLLIVKALRHTWGVSFQVRRSLGDERLLLLKVVVQIPANLSLLRHSQSPSSFYIGQFDITHTDVTVEDCLGVVQGVVSQSLGQIVLGDVVGPHSFVLKLHGGEGGILLQTFIHC